LPEQFLIRSAMDFSFRQIHLDFHTSEHIPDIGIEFDAGEFVSTLQSAAVESVTLFAKCHHGWSYYPTSLGTPHPHLARPDLLGEMIAACREAGLGVSLYLTVQWDELTAREHPEWRVVRAQSPGEGHAEWHQLSPGWHPLSLANKALVKRIEAQALELVDRFAPDGLFFDILLTYDDVSQAALERMRRLGLDPNQQADRLRSEQGAILEFTQRIRSAVHARDDRVRLFHNSGHIAKNERERWEPFTHFELESLPTGGWGYDHFPVSAAYVAQLGKPYLGMTGKFHTTWGEFGGYKRAVALEYECALMVAMGARCSIGDQLHPTGRIDADTYRLIAPAYARIEKLEPYLRDAQTVPDIALYSAEGHHRSREHERSDNGAARILFELHRPFAVIDEGSDFSAYKLIILPDTIQLSDTLARRFEAFLGTGGALLLSGSSGLTPEGDRFALPFAATPHGQREYCPDYLAVADGLDPDLVASPFVMYQKAHDIRSEGATVLGRIHDPYFNRTWEHFCSHQHTPPRPEPSEQGAGILQDGRIITFAHPIFRLYHAIGQPLYKYAVRGALRRLLPAPRIETNLPSGARLNLLRQDGERRWLLHLLYAPLQRRGNEVQTWQGKEAIEIIEESLPLHDIACSIALEAAPRRIFLAPDGPELPFEFAEGRAEFTVPRLELHALVVIEDATPASDQE